MGFFDKAKRLLGIGASDEEDEPAAPAPPAKEAASADPRAERLARARGRKDRPPLVEVPAEQGQTIEDVLNARDQGDRKGARQILATIDRGGGLRTVLRAAAALEDGDEDELGPLLATVKSEAAGYKLWLQIGMALGDPAEAKAYVDRAASENAPAWALAWARALSGDPVTRREGLVTLLFTDAALARTVASRDLGVEGAAPDAEAASRYTAFAHGRDCIKRFGARSVGDLLERAVRA